MSRPGRRLTDQVASELVLDTDPFLSCDDCFALMDLYVESVLDGPGRRAMAGAAAVAVHLAGCPACAEETQSLVDLLTTDAPSPDTGGHQWSQGPGSGRQRGNGDDLPAP